MKKLISFLHNKLSIVGMDKDDKYIDVVNDMYEDNVLNDKDIRRFRFKVKKKMTLKDKKYLLL